MRAMFTTSNVQFLPPFPDGIIVNEGQGANINFVKGKTYRIRIISFSAFASAMVHFDSHTMQVIMNDASYLEQQQAYILRVTPAQRYDVLISAIDRDHGNYPFLMALDINRDWQHDPPQFVAWPHNATGYLVMDPSGDMTRQDVVSSFTPVDDSHFVPLGHEAILPDPVKTYTLDFSFCRDENNLPR